MTTCLVRILPRKIKNIDTFKKMFSDNLCVCPYANKLKDVFHKSVKSVQPEILLQNRVQLLSENHKALALHVCGDEVKLAGRKIRVLGFGKAVVGMAKEIDGILGEHMYDGMLIAPAGTNTAILTPRMKDKFAIMMGAVNNIADAASVKATEIAFDYVKRLDENDLLLVLISGGGSALLSLPVGGIHYTEKAVLIKTLADRGARIDEMNTVRKKLSAVKGGKLAQAAQPAQVVALTLSDVIGDNLEVIASGPTVPNSDADDAAKHIIEKFGLRETLSKAMHEYIYITGSTQISNCNQVLANSVTYLIGNNVVAVKKAAEEAKIIGYQSLIVCTTVQGEVVQISKTYAEIAQVTRKYVKKLITKNEYTKNLRDICMRAQEHRKVDINISKDLESRVDAWPEVENGVWLIFAGEPVVQVNTKTNGLGGRSQHLALLFSQEMAALETTSARVCKEAAPDIWLLCGGTDGADGPTDAAGAVACARLAADAAREGLDITQAIADCDSYSFLEKFQGGSRLIKTGKTGTNVMDLHFLVVAKSS